MSEQINHTALLAIVHEEAGRTLSRDDFDLCMRIAKRAALFNREAPEGCVYVKTELLTEYNALKQEKLATPAAASELQANGLREAAGKVARAWETANSPTTLALAMDEAIPALQATLSHISSPVRTVHAAPQCHVPELTSIVINDACWKFIEAMPHQLPGPIFNGLKPALYSAICHVLAATPPATGADDARDAK